MHPVERLEDERHRVAAAPAEDDRGEGHAAGSFARGDRSGLFVIGAVKRLFGWAAFSFEAGVHGRPRQSVRESGAGPSLPSHQTSPSAVRATFV